MSQNNIFCVISILLLLGMNINQQKQIDSLNYQLFINAQNLLKLQNK